MPENIYNFVVHLNGAANEEKARILYFHFHFRVAPRGTVGTAVLFLTRSATVFVDGETDIYRPTVVQARTI